MVLALIFQNIKLKFNKKISDKYVFVGRLIADKGIRELVEAFKIFNKNNKNQD